MGYLLILIGNGRGVSGMFKSKSIKLIYVVSSQLRI